MDINNPVKVLIGHNRYATLGAHTEENAHPFAFEHVMGAHNGTLDKFTIKNLHDANLYDTDSQAIFSTINEVGVVETMKRVTGAWALTWFDKRDGTLNFLRNDKRPLHYCYSADRCTLIWASEPEMLKYVLGRRRKKTEGDEFFTITKDTHYKWKVPTVVTKKFDSPEQSKVEGKSCVYATVPFTGGATTTTTVKTFAGYKKSDSNVLSFNQKFDTKRFRPPYKDIYGHTINKQQFEHMVAEGCAFCNDNSQEWGDFIQIMGNWNGAKNTPFMCEVCYGDVDCYETLRHVM